MFTSKKTTDTKPHWSPIIFEDLVDSEINKPARYLGNELGTKARDWGTATVHWALTYPELYEVGASNLGHIILYSILNSIPGNLCDRAYLPAKDMARRLRERSEVLFGLESRMPLAAFDLLGFSLSYELGATNILEMLDLSKLPLYSRNRGNLPLDDPLAPPLIFAGGPTATSNPEPFAPFFDFFALGDGEELLPEIGLVVSEGKRNKLSRSNLLIDLAQIPGIYVPSLYEVGLDGKTIESIHPSAPKAILRRVATPLPQYGMGLIPNIETIHDRLKVEIRRGCTRGCRFCQPGMLTRPARDVEPNEIVDAVKKGLNETGYSDLSLLSLSCSDYLALPAVGTEIRNQLADQQITLQLPSQRVDRFDNNIANILGGSRQAGLTFAPEAGTQHLRDIINKGLTDQELLRGIRTAMRHNYRKVKLYFMIGLPGECDEDVVGIVKTCKMLQNECRDLGRLKLNVTISNFTPKPHTPFQWHSVSITEFEKKQKLLKDAFKELRGIKANFTDIRLSAMEDFIGRGDRRIAPVLEAAWKKGAGMDAWFECLEQTYQAWTEAISDAGLKGQYRNLELGNWSAVEGLGRHDLYNFCSQALPWDHIDTGIDKNWLIRDLMKALKSNVTEDCSFFTCSSCGVCGEDLGHNIIVEPPAIPAQVKVKKPSTERTCKIRFKFSKTGPMVFLSHLDVVRILERAIRRSKLPISFSGGFHPLPRIQIALALPLGIEASGEWMDIDFTKELEPEFVLKQIQDYLPIGLVLLTAKSVNLKRKSISQDLVEAHWSFELRSTSEVNTSEFELLSAIDSITNSHQLIWEDFDKKGRPRQRDCLPNLKTLEVKFPADSELGIKAIGSMNNALIRLEARIDSLGRSIKPNQVKYWLEKHIGKSLEITSIKRDELILFEC